MDKTFLPEDLLKMDRFYRINFFNSLNGYKNASLIGTISAKKNTNLAIFNSVVHIGTNPPLLGFILRPTTVERHTYQNLKDTGYFTINHITEAHFENAHQTSAKYPAEQSEFEACNFTTAYSSIHPAPYVRESPIKIGLSYKEEHLITANQTILVIGQVEEIIVPEKVIADTGHINLEEAGSIAVVGLDSYYKANRIGRLGYAKP